MWDIVSKVLIGVLSALLISACTYYVTKIRSVLKKQADEQEAMRKGLKALLRDRIIQMYNHYYNQRCIPIYARDNIGSLHAEYKALGGNGTIDGLVKKLMSLDTDASHAAEHEDRSVV